MGEGGRGRSAEGHEQFFTRPLTAQVSREEMGGRGWSEEGGGAGGLLAGWLVA